MGRKSTILIVALWAGFLADAAWGGWTSEADMPDVPPWFVVVAIAMLFVIFPLSAVRATASPFQFGPLARWTEARAGTGAYESFLRRLRPTLLIVAGASVAGVAAAARAMSADAPLRDYFPVAFMGGAALSFAAAHVVLKRRGVPGV